MNMKEEMPVKRGSRGAVKIPKGFRRLTGNMKVKRGDYFLIGPGTPGERWTLTSNHGCRVRDCFPGEEQSKHPYIRKI